MVQFSSNQKLHQQAQKHFSFYIRKSGVDCPFWGSCPPPLPWSYPWSRLFNGGTVELNPPEYAISNRVPDTNLIKLDFNPSSAHSYNPGKNLYCGQRARKWKYLPCPTHTCKNSNFGLPPPPVLGWKIINWLGENFVKCMSKPTL